MKPELKKIWIEAMKSGEYKQASGGLCCVRPQGDVGFCCLGVAYDVLSDGDWSSRNVDGKAWGIQDESGYISYGMPEAKVLNEWGLSITDAKTLAKLNDEGWTFEQIADEIERDGRL